MKSRFSTSTLAAVAATLLAVSCSKQTMEPSGTPRQGTAQTSRPRAAASESETYRDFLARMGGEDVLFARLDKPATIGLLGVSKTHEYQLRRDAAARTTAEKMHVKLLLDHYESDVTTQRTKAEDMAVRGVQVLISTARDDESFTALADFLKREKVCLVSEGGTNDKFTRADLPNYVTYVGVNNYQNGFGGGVWAAGCFQKNFPDQKPRLAVANYPSNKATNERATGFIAGFQSIRPELEVQFNGSVGGGGGRDQLLPFIEDVFTAHNFNIFFGVWDEAAIAGWTAARTRGLTAKDIMILGYDGTFEVAKLVAEPESLFVADIAQDPELSGRVTLAIAAKVATGQWQPEELPMFIYIPGMVITRENARAYLQHADQGGDRP